MVAGGESLRVLAIGLPESGQFGLVVGGLSAATVSLVLHTVFVGPPAMRPAPTGQKPNDEDRVAAAMDTSGSMGPQGPVKDRPTEEINTDEPK
jgi:hypothetical protein